MNELAQTARGIFAETLAQLDVAQALRNAVQYSGAMLRVAGQPFSLKGNCPVSAVALGKAALPMAQTLAETLGARLTGGVVAAPSVTSSRLDPSRWQVFAGGHPLPNEASLKAAQAVFALLRVADAQCGLVIFLISGGGSALLEYPSDKRLTLQDLQLTNRILVNCGASIAEINVLRRALSAVKGGGLSRAAPRARQISLIVSDTNPGDLASVASGPSLPAPPDAPAVDDILARYNLLPQLPPWVVSRLQTPPILSAPGPPSFVHVLLDQDTALDAAVQNLSRRGWVAAPARHIVEQPVERGAQLLWAELRRQILMRASDNGNGEGDGSGSGVKGVGVVSVGEFACPVRGDGQGGRNTETTLRLALILNEQRAWLERCGWRVVALSGGTDGIDGNSPAAGAVATEETITRALAQDMEAADFLARSDSYRYFAALGDAILTGPTGTNVRDIRILLAARLPAATT